MKLFVDTPIDWKFSVDTFAKIPGIFENSRTSISFSTEFQYLVALRKHYSPGV